MAALTAQVADLQGRVAKLEGNITAADLVGTYAVHQITSEMIAENPANPAGPPTLVAFSATMGTAVLGADGSVCVTVTTKGNTLKITPPPSLIPFSNGSGSGCSTWTYASGIVNVPGGPQLSVAAGGRVLIYSFAGDINIGQLILTRLQ